MSLADRARAALWSNVNAILTRLEQSSQDLPALLEQMGQEIQKAKRELVRVLGEERVLRERSKSQAIEAHKWQSRAELAVRGGDDKLARDALSQYRRLQGESARDAAAADEYGALAQSIRAGIAKMEEGHRGWTARQGTMGSMSKQAHAGGGTEALGARAGHTPFEDFRRAEQAIDAAETAQEAQKEVQELLAPGADLDQRFRGLEAEPDANAPKGVPQQEASPESASSDSAPKRRVRID